MSMTRKDYNLIATTIGWHLRDYTPDSREWNALIDCASGLAADLRATNPRFDSDRFLTFVHELPGESATLTEGKWHDRAASDWATGRKMAGSGMGNLLRNHRTENPLHRHRVP
jgi:hypothetical protein